MNYILGGVIGILVINFLYIKIDGLIDKLALSKYKKMEPIEGKYLSVLNEFKERRDINLKIHFVIDPKAKQVNCRTKTFKNEAFIVVEKAINEQRIKGAIAHELGHIEMKHEEKSNRFLQNNIFIANLLIIAILLYFLLPLKIGLLVLLIAFVSCMCHLLIVYPYEMRKQELEADNVAVELMGKEYIDSLNSITGLVANLPSCISDHPSIEARKKNADKKYGRLQREKYN